MMAAGYHGHPGFCYRGQAIGAIGARRRPPKGIAGAVQAMLVPGQ